jgi:hypothetical protein
VKIVIMRVGLYGGFFAGMLAVALLLTGVLQQGILPRLNGRSSHPATEQPAPAPSGTPAVEQSAAAQPAPAKSAAETTGAEQPATGAASAPAPSPAPGMGAHEAPRPSAAPALPPSVAAKGTGVPEREGQAKRLARVYEGMRPKEAAAVLEKLDRPLAAQVLAEIRDRQTSKILGAMNPATAAELTRLFGQPAERATP